MAEPLALQVRGISRKYGSFFALCDVSFDVRNGEIITLLGKSGSGKSTLLRCIDLLEPIDQGAISYEEGFHFERKGPDGLFLTEAASGISHAFPSFANRLRRSIGLVSQSYDLWEEKTVLQNLILAPRVVLGESTNEAAERAGKLCERFGLGDRLDARAWQLSGGQRQRIAIIRALMMRPRLLLLDEITSSLDPVLTYEVMQLIRELKADGMTMLIVTHHLKFGLAIGDRILFLENGRVIQDTTPAEFVSSPANQEVKEFIEVLNSLG